MESLWVGFSVLIGLLVLFKLEAVHKDITALKGREKQ
jgi:hypothetical protein